LGWAGDYELKHKGIEDAKSSRAEQVLDYNNTLHEMQEDLKDNADGLSKGTTFIHRQLQLFANAALGATIARSAIKSMMKADEWRQGLEKQYGNKAGTTDTADSLIKRITDAVTAKVGGGGGGGPGSGGGGGGGGGGSTPHQTGPNPNPKSGGGGSKAPPPADSGNARALGLYMPTSQGVVGTNVVGATANVGTCMGCSAVGHLQMECPKLFGQTFTGRAMPGWFEDGSKNNACWEGSKITPACLNQWVAMQKIGFFTKTTKGPAAPMRLV
jgi:hypothetical protein